MTRGVFNLAKTAALSPHKNKAYVWLRNWEGVLKNVLLSWSIALGISLGLIANHAVADVESKSVNVRVKTAFVPMGFDSNDEVVVVLDGYLPDTCYKLGETEVKREKNTIQITQKGKEYTGNCFDVTVPFTRVVRVGVLESGEYTVVSNGGGEKSNLTIKEATKAGPDDFLYAPVEQARVVGKSAILTGRMTNSCLKITDVKLNHTEKTVQVLPIMKLLNEEEAGHECVVGEVAFEYTASLAELKLDAGRHLLHVRSLDGQSVNTVFTNP